MAFTGRDSLSRLEGQLIVVDLRPWILLPFQSVAVGSHDSQSRWHFVIGNPAAGLKRTQR